MVFLSENCEKYKRFDWVKEKANKFHIFIIVLEYNMIPRSQSEAWLARVQNSGNLNQIWCKNIK